VAALPDDVLAYKDLESTGAVIVEQLRTYSPKT